MSYVLSDFVESLRGGTGINHREEHPITIDPKTVKHVHAAWGYSPEGYGSWSGGFLLELTDGRFAYLTGWCDTTGWGCQDGSQVTFFDAKPALELLDKPTTKEPYDNEAPGEWDIDPADLNKWIADGADMEDRF